MALSQRHSPLYSNSTHKYAYLIKNNWSIWVCYDRWPYIRLLLHHHTSCLLPFSSFARIIVLREFFLDEFFFWLWRSGRIRPTWAMGTGHSWQHLAKPCNPWSHLATAIWAVWAEWARQAPYIMPPMPPIPPMPPMPPPPMGMGGASSLISVMTASAVVSREATPAASVMALRTTWNVIEVLKILH